MLWCLIPLVLFSVYGAYYLGYKRGYLDNAKRARTLLDQGHSIINRQALMIDKLTKELNHKGLYVVKGEDNE